MQCCSPLSHWQLPFYKGFPPFHGKSFLFCSDICIRPLRLFPNWRFCAICRPDLMYMICNIYNAFRNSPFSTDNYLDRSYFPSYWFFFVFSLLLNMLQERTSWIICWILSEATRLPVKGVFFKSCFLYLNILYKLIGRIISQ